MSKIGCEILQISPDKIKFSLNNCDVSMANSLRRVLLSQVPTLAPHLVSVVENTSVLHDEFLAQRIGLIPFYSQRVQDYKYTWDCDCSEELVDDCQVCKNYFRLQVENNSQETREVTSLDIQPIFPVDMQIGSKKPVIPVEFTSGLDKGKKVGIPIVKLDKNQKINIRFDVQKGFGKMHSKWSPVSLATFQPDPEIKIDEKIDIKVEQKKMIVDSCPKKVFDMNENNIEVAHQERCIYCGQCTRKAEGIDMTKFKNYLRIGKKKDKYIFTVESVGSMPTSMIVKIAIKTLQQKLNQLQQKIN